MPTDLSAFAHELATAQAFERATLDLLQSSVGFDVAFFSVKGAEAAPTVVGLSPDLVQRAVAAGPTYDRELLPIKQAALQAHGVAVDTRVLGENAVRKTAYYREVARAVGGRHSLLAYVPLRGRIVAAILLGRCGSGFSDADLATVASILPELGLARASYGLPLRYEPLKVPARTGLLRGLGALHRPSPLAQERIGNVSVEVRDRAGFREMVARDSGSELVWTRANLRDPSESGWPYIELLHLAAIQAKARQRALFIGCGGAVALRQFARLYPGIAIDLVEREQRVIDLARAWYDLDGIPGLTVHIADGAEFAAHAPPAAWDVAVIDAFDGSDATAALSQPKFLAAVRGLLRDGGALAMNLLGTLEGQGAVAGVARHLSQSFQRVRVVPVMGANERYSSSDARNIVLIASK